MNTILIVQLSSSTSLADIVNAVRNIRVGSDEILVDLGAQAPEPVYEPVYGDTVDVWIADRQDLYAEEAVIALKRLGILDATIDMVRGVNVNYPLCVGTYRLSEGLEDLVADINDEQGLGDDFVYIGGVPEHHEVFSNSHRTSIMMFNRLGMQPLNREC